VNDLGDILGAPIPVKAGDHTLLLYQQTLGTLAIFQRWIDQQTFDPEEFVCRNIELLPPESHEYLLSRGIEKADRSKPQLGTESAEEITYSSSGLSELLYLSISRGRKTSRAEASRLYWKLDRYGVRVLMGTLWGDCPKKGSSQGAIMGSPNPNERIDWWRIIHALSGDPAYLSISQIKRLTWTQASCLAEKEFDRKVSSQAEYDALLAEERKGWDS
jgi:hypothetical protein